MRGFFSPAVLLLPAILAGVASLAAQQPSLPSIRLVRAPSIVMPGAVDSSVPFAWDLVDGRWQLFALASWGGVPALLTGASVTEMQRVGDVTIAPHPGHGIWMESVVPDDAGTWYGYYHHEAPAERCGRMDRFIRGSAPRDHSTAAARGKTSASSSKAPPRASPARR